jgi:hypothetical protein
MSRSASIRGHNATTKQNGLPGDASLTACQSSSVRKGSRLSKAPEYGVCRVHEVNIVFSYPYHSAHFAELAVVTGVQGLLRFTLPYSNDRRSDTVMMRQTYADTPVTPHFAQTS